MMGGREGRQEDAEAWHECVHGRALLPRMLCDCVVHIRKKNRARDTQAAKETKAPECDSA